jgi:hypothetical protein
MLLSSAAAYNRISCASHLMGKPAAAGCLQIDPRPDGPTRGALLPVVGRIAWAAALSGAAQLAEQCARRAAASPVSTHLARCRHVRNDRAAYQQHVRTVDAHLADTAHLPFVVAALSYRSLQLRMCHASCR